MGQAVVRHFGLCCLLLSGLFLQILLDGFGFYLPVQSIEVSQAINSAGPDLEPIAVFSLRDGQSSEPHFLEEVPTNMLVPAGSYPVHKAHVLGLPHGGIWLLVLDNRSRVLCIRRQASLKTCPSKWSLLGEHQHESEDLDTLAQRAVDEELGLKMRSYTKKIVPLSQSPLWYRRDYADGRRDRQAMFLAAVLMNGTGESMPLAADDEIADLRWVSISDLTAWLQRESADWCHETTLSLLRRTLSLWQAKAKHNDVF